MRIVIDATAAVSGGRLYIEKLIGNFAEKDGGHELIIVHAGDLAELEHLAERDSFQFHRVRLLPFLNLPIIPPGLWRLIWRKLFLSTLLNRFNPDLFFSNSGFAPAKHSRSFKTIIALHNSMPLREELIKEETSFLLRLRLIWLRKLIHRSLKNCDAAIVFSEDTQRTIREKFPDVQTELDVIHHGMDWNTDNMPVDLNARRLAQLGISRPYLLYVSQFHRYKNVIRLLEAFAKVIEGNPDLQLVLVGQRADPAYWREIESSMHRLRIETRVKYIHACPREELQDLYRGALVFVHPSLAETCSFPLLEAMALGVPIAAARMSALPEMAGDAALYFDPYNVDDMASVLTDLVDREELRSDLSTRAIARARQFSWEETARRTLEVFERVARHP